ncbi:structural protein [Synechococcus phage S-SZBM1]|uniref:Structural protein n=1 Tax=Synechococcus phage S-SZBM1 TaxID=2926475 RepID=A0AC61TT94_9CAUD|nr:structural protein [Synechococcus phage S-SZBM1]UNH61324.1 structural protein [Synechococcus phage S-SZBM1]
MTATAEYNPATKILTVDGDGLPNPVSYGTFPNAYNPNLVTEQDFQHDFYYRGGTFGITRTFDDNTFTQNGYLIQIPLSPNDNSLLGSAIVPGDHVLFVFDEGTENELKQRFVYTGTTQTTTAGQFWRASDQYLELVVENPRLDYSGTYTYYDQRNGRISAPLGAIGVAANGVVFYNPSAGDGGNPPVGFHWNAHYENSPVNFGDDACGGHPEPTGQYHYHDTHFLDCWKENSIIASYNDYYGLSQYNGDNLRHPDSHSKILGFAFDGFPIYGPYCYQDPWDNLSPVVLASSSYRIKAEEAPGRPVYGTTLLNPPAGSLMEDWEYSEGLGMLDFHNGRYCVTPEYPNGTYAYFLATEEGNESELIPQFPYIMGTTSRESLDQPFNSGAKTPPPPPTDEGGEVIPPTIQITSQPQNVTTNAGITVQFVITTQILPEDGPKRYQWYRSTDGGFSYATINGATSNTLQFTALAYMSGYKYKCVVIGPVGALPAQNSPLESDVATLTITGVGDGQTAEDFSSTNLKFSTTIVSFDAT